MARAGQNEQCFIFSGKFFLTFVAKNILDSTKMDVINNILNEIEVLKVVVEKSQKELYKTQQEKWRLGEELCTARHELEQKNIALKDADEHINNLNNKIRELVQQIPDEEDNSSSEIPETPTYEPAAGPTVDVDVMLPWYNPTGRPNKRERSDPNKRTVVREVYAPQKRRATARMQTGPTISIRGPDAQKLRRINSKDE